MSAAVQASPDNVALRKHLAELLLQAERFAEAEREYRAALDRAPHDTAIKLGLAQAYYSQHKADVALVILEELMRGHAATPEVLLLAARAYLDTGAPQDAARAYQQAIAQKPDLADTALASQLPPLESSGQTPTQAVFLTAQANADIPLFEIERPRINFNDVGGMDKLKEEIRLKIIYPLTHPQLYRAYGKTAGGGILMYGPPGCGKTFLARATAGEVHASFMAVGIHQVLDMYVGQSEKNLHTVFDQARRHAPCVLFFDEVDALGASRSDMRQAWFRHVVNQFLNELDGVESSNEGVLILAATNMPWFVDPAMRRPGRFDRVIFVPPPDTSARESILRLMLADKPVEKIDYRKLAQATTGFSGADLKGAVDRAIEGKLQQALRKGVPAPLTTDDLFAAIKTMRPTLREWFATARNYATFSNEGGQYDDILEYLKQPEGSLYRG